MGKTTVARRLAEHLHEASVPVRGFVTGEIREGGRRVRFSVASFPGACATLAHVDLPGPPRVGKYGVDLPAFERVALPELAGVGELERAIVVIDELGKMELASKPFREAVAGLFGRGLALVATVHIFAHPFTDRLKQASEVELIRVTHGNRDQLPADLARRLCAS